ncbi:MAG TPA: hypothetical protein VJI32_05215 [Candidatus Nanoarchaeia archaeon]|nr:hypothetical protein [Candidatus Nanoarchaeia archaeon]
MAERYKTYQFRISAERRAEEDLNFATAEKMMGALEEICQDGVQLQREVNNLPLIGGVEVLYLVGNAVVRNKTSGVAPYCETEIICRGKPTDNIVERYQEFYHSDPTVVHF